MKTSLIVPLLLAATLGTARAEVATYAADPTHTFVNFEVKHFGTSTLRGRFDKKSGTVTLDRAAKSGKVEFIIDTSSLSTGLPALDTHLKSKDFLNAAEAPTARFAGTDLRFEGDKVTAVTGTLTLLGKTAPVTLKATNFNCYNNPMLKVETCGGDFETTIQRSQWGIAYGIEYGIPDSVRLLIQVEGIKQ
jgi:polyisoprenoid-binding protein YceI